MPDGFDLDTNLEDTLIPPGLTPPADEASLPEPSQPQAQDVDTSGVPGEASPGSSDASHSSLPSSLLSRAQQLGLPLDGINDTESLAQAILDQYAQLHPYAEYGRSALSQPVAQGNHAPSHQDYEQPAAEEFDEQKYFSEAWAVPELSQGAKFALEHGAFKVDESGMLVPDDTRPHLQSIALQYLKEINDYQQTKASLTEAYSANPVKYTLEKMWPVMEHRIRQMQHEHVQERFQQADHQRFEEKFKEDNASWLYNQARTALTPDGQRFVETVRELRSQGITDPQRLAAYALKLSGINTNPAPAAPAQQPAAPAAQDNRARDEHGRFLPAGKPAPAPTKQEAFLDKARRIAAPNSNQKGYVDGGMPVPDNEGDLDNIWTQGWATHTSGIAVK